jgi:outer membrane receptor for ferrienterochelin and colicins
METKKNTIKSSVNQTLILSILVTLSLLFINAQVFAEEPGGKDKAYIDMSLEELMNIPVTSTSLTTVASGRDSPSTVTTITQQDIQNSGARSLIELLEIYVPNLQMILHTADARHMGLRGIISNVDDKYLLLINGRMMNEHTSFGVMSERDMPMLRDIHQIDVVRGPGSAMYGPGALAMVINITTDNANTFKGFEVSQRVGVVEEHYTTEFKYGKQLENGAGLFLYGGISEYPGASLDNAPLTYGSYGTAWFHYAYDEKATSLNAGHYNAGYAGQPKIKLHGQYTKDDLDVWLRYTQGGENVDASHPWNNAWGWPAGTPGNLATSFGLGYRQATAALNYKQDLADNFALKYLFSYMHTEMLTSPSEFNYQDYGEDEYYGQIIANWKINENHEFAFGGAWRHNEFGFPPWGDDTATVYRISTTGNVMPRWGTDMFSLFGEYQWHVNDQLTAFVSAREDDHTYTTPMFSPRLSLVYTPTDVDTFKLMASRAVRTNNDAEMENTYLGKRSNSEVEVLKAYEARYERKVGSNILLAADAFIHNQSIIGWVNEGAGLPGHTGPLATERLWGFEAEASYVKDRFRFDVSHGFTKLLDYVLAPPTTSSEDTAVSMGSKDLSNWYNNISKMRVHYQADDKLSLDSSLIVYWNNPGGEDNARSNSWTYNRRASDVFYNSWYLNLGLQYQYSKNLTMRVDAYNVLGLFDESLNQRREGFNWSAPAEVRTQPVALGLQVVYKF